MVVETGQMVVLPPNPFYKFKYSIPLSHGHATLDICAPGGQIKDTDLILIRQWFALIESQLLTAVEGNATQ